jgi:hypothetical protein
MRTLTGQDSKPIARREAIEACVRAWIRNNPEEFAKWERFMQNKRVGLADRKFGRVKEDNATFQEEMRLTGSIPKSLMDAMDELMKYHNQGRLFFHGTDEDRKAEGNWFFNKFKIFRVSEKL